MCLDFQEAGVAIVSKGTYIRQACYDGLSFRKEV
jgi:hypothetical protein